MPLAAARKRIVSYMEAGDLAAINAAIDTGFPICGVSLAMPPSTE